MQAASHSALHSEERTAARDGDVAHDAVVLRQEAQLVVAARAVVALECHVAWRRRRVKEARGQALRAPPRHAACKAILAKSILVCCGQRMLQVLLRNGVGLKGLRMSAPFPTAISAKPPHPSLGPHGAAQREAALQWYCRVCMLEAS